MEEQEILKTWYTSRNLSKRSQRIYESILNKYKRYTRKSFEELIDEAKTEEENRIRLRKWKIMDYIVVFKMLIRKYWS